MAKDFEIAQPKWRNFAKSGHTRGKKMFYCVVGHPGLRRRWSWCTETRLKLTPSICSTSSRITSHSLEPSGRLSMSGTKPSRLLRMLRFNNILVWVGPLNISLKPRSHQLRVAATAAEGQVAANNRKFLLYLLQWTASDCSGRSRYAARLNEP